MKCLIAILIIVIAAFGCKQTGKANSTATISEKDSVTISDYIDGKMLFVNNCVTCHPLNKIVSPQLLSGISERWKNNNLLYEFIRNPQAVITKDAYAKKMHEDFGKTNMPSFSNLTDKQITQILLYINITLEQKPSLQ